MWLLRDVVSSPRTVLRIACSSSSVHQLQTHTVVIDNKVGSLYCYQYLIQYWYHTSSNDPTARKYGYKEILVVLE